MQRMDMVMRNLKKGKRGDVARAITMAENNPAAARPMMKKIFKDSKKRSAVLGITGPAGSGKSSLINLMTVIMKKQNLKPAVLAVDPTSSITGGAMLGDRTRMSESTDTGAFIRSLASRGAVGAVARSVRDCIRILEYAGFNPILLESVGAGQTETAISAIADATIVVFNPQTGDNIQAIKAGLTEIGDIYVINKSELAGAAHLYNAVREYIGGTDGPPVLKTSVRRNTGILRLVKESLAIAREKMGDGDAERGRIKSEVRDIILNILSDKADALLESKGAYGTWVSRIQGRKTDPYSAAARMAAGIK